MTGTKQQDANSQNQPAFLVTTNFMSTGFNQPNALANPVKCIVACKPKKIKKPVYILTEGFSQAIPEENRRAPSLIFIKR